MATSREDVRILYKDASLNNDEAVFLEFWWFFVRLVCKSLEREMRDEGSGVGSPVVWLRYQCEDWRVRD